MTDLELLQRVKRWTDGTLPAKEWTHAAHVATCAYFAWNYTLPETYSLMKDGLYRFNEVCGVPNTDERGYHETLTRFWCTLLFFKIHQAQFRKPCEAANSMNRQYGHDSRAERAYYSFDVLKSKEARRHWIAPDVRNEIALQAFLW